MKRVSYGDCGPGPCPEKTPSIITDATRGSRDSHPSHRQSDRSDFKGMATFALVAECERPINELDLIEVVRALALTLSVITKASHLFVRAAPPMLSNKKQAAHVSRAMGITTPGERTLSVNQRRMTLSQSQLL